MNLEQKKVEIERNIKRLSENLKLYRDEYESLKNSVQPKTTDLYNGIENFFTIDINKGSYEYVLGGDGRSQPWSESRNGLVATIKINKGIYLNEEQIKVIKEYAKEVYKVDYIRFP